MLTLVLYTLLTTCAFYLGSEAEITKFLWSRYPGSGLTRCRVVRGGAGEGVDAYDWNGQVQVCPPADVGFSAFMRCPACVGFWWGIMLGLFGAYHRVPFMGLPGRWWVTVLFTGLSSVVWTPLLAHLHRKALGG